MKRDRGAVLKMPAWPETPPMGERVFRHALRLAPDDDVSCCQSLVGAIQGPKFFLAGRYIVVFHGQRIEDRRLFARVVERGGR